MDLTELIAALRQDYVPSLEQKFEDERHRLGQKVSTEITLRLSTGQLQTVDIAIDKELQFNFIDVAGAARFYTGSTDYTLGPMALHFEATGWDGMLFAPSPRLHDHDAVDAWTRRWMDIDGHNRIDAMAPFGGIIHHVGWNANGSFDVDFGSAPPEAAFSLFQLLADQGVKTLEISSARQ